MNWKNYIITQKNYGGNNMTEKNLLKQQIKTFSEGKNLDYTSRNAYYRYKVNMYQNFVLRGKTKDYLIRFINN